MLEKFEKRRDRYELFNSMENPLVNITFKYVLEDFRPYCRMKGYPPFHFFLYHIFSSLMKVENFRYRIFETEIIRIDRLIPSYTVMNTNDVLNFTRFEHSSNLDTFIKRSLAAKIKAESSEKLLHSANEFTPREIKDYIFVTCIPWLDFTSIQHPIFKFRNADIPSIAWGKFSKTTEGKLAMPFSVQAHHGLVDGFHIHQLGLEIEKSIQQMIKDAP